MISLTIEGDQVQYQLGDICDRFYTVSLPFVSSDYYVYISLHQQDDCWYISTQYITEAGAPMSISTGCLCMVKTVRFIYHSAFPESIDILGYDSEIRIPRGTSSGPVSLIGDSFKIGVEQLGGCFKEVLLPNFSSGSVIGIIIYQNSAGQYQIIVNITNSNLTQSTLGTTFIYSC